VNVHECQAHAMLKIMEFLSRQVSSYRALAAHSIILLKYECVSGKPILRNHVRVVEDRECQKNSP
jgi:hypothetical protein